MESAWRAGGMQVRSTVEQRYAPAALYEPCYAAACIRYWLSTTPVSFVSCCVCIVIIAKCAMNMNKQLSDTGNV